MIGRAIITYSRGWQALAATRSLGARGVDVITADEYALTPASFSKYSSASFRYPNVSTHPEQFLDTLEAAIRKHAPEDPDVPYVLMPIHKETYLIAEHRERFEKLICLPIPNIDAILQVHNKGILARYAQEKNIPQPQVWLPETTREFMDLAKEISFPAFVKLRESAAGVGIAKVDTLQELTDTFTDFVKRYATPPGQLPIIQAGVPGDDYCVTTLFNRGTLLASMTYHNLRAYPAEKGAGVLRETVPAPKMEQLASEILSPLDWHGVAELDFRWDGKAESTPYLIEVNPRFWGGLSQAIESGWDYPWMLYQLAAEGDAAPPVNGRYDVRTETPILGFLATLQEMADNTEHMDQLKVAWREARTEFREGSKRAGLRKILSGIKNYADPRGRFKEAKRLLEDHRHNVYDVLSARDPLPALGILYPLAVFLKHGKVNMELLTSEGAPVEKDEDA